MCMGNVNMLVRCLGKPLRIENKFRKRNFNAIVDVTGAACGVGQAGRGAHGCTSVPGGGYLALPCPPVCDAGVPGYEECGHHAKAAV